MSEHPKLERAKAELVDGDAGPLIGIAMRARMAQDEGRYCECAEPLLAGDDLMCGTCLLNNKGQERKRCATICNAHEFVPSEKFEFMCSVCSNGEDAPRHHGVDAVPRYSWDPA